MEKTEKKKLVFWMIGIGFFFWILLFMFVLGNGLKQVKATTIFITDTNGTNSFDSGVIYDDNKTYKNDTIDVSINFNSVNYTDTNNPNYLYVIMNVALENEIPVINSNNEFYIRFWIQNAYINTNQYVYSPCLYDSNISKCVSVAGGQAMRISHSNGNNSTSLGFNVVLAPNGLYIRLNQQLYLMSLESGGGYTQQDVDQAYSDGQLNALNTASSSTHGSGTTYTSYIPSNMTQEMLNSYSEGELDVLNTISQATIGQGIHIGTQTVYNSYTSANLYTELRYNFAEGEVQMLNNVANAGKYGSGTTYDHTFTNSDVTYESNYKYAYGIADTTNALAETSTGDTSVYGYPYTAGLILDPSIWSDKFAWAKYQQSHAWGVGRLEVLNYISVTYPGGTETVYSSYTQNNLNTEISGIQQTAYNLGAQNNAGYIRGKIDVLNEVSHSLHGSQTNYTDYNSTDLQNEETTIYNAGINYGVSASGSSQSLTRFIPNVFGAIAGSLWPVMTYQVFGVSLLSIFLVLLGIALAYIIIKMLL